MRLRVDAVESITWADGRRVAVQGRATEEAAATWTLEPWSFANVLTSVQVIGRMRSRCFN
jgi:hypothetical protein